MAKDKEIKLSDKQKEVIKKMQEGWELGSSGTFDGKCWMQKNGLGRGGESKTVRLNTFTALRNMGLIKQRVYSFPTIPYELTEAGKKIKID